MMNEEIIALDLKAKSLADKYLLTQGEILTVLMELLKRNGFAILNYANIFEYCEKRLRLSRQQAYYYKSVAERSFTVPALKEAVVQEEITLSQARRIASVITEDTKQEWIKDAKELPQAELEKKVAEHNPKARVKERIRPVAKQESELKVVIDDQTEANIRALTDILSQKLQRPATLREVIAFATNAAREKFDPEKKAERSIKRKSVSSGNPKPGRRPIPKSVKNQVIEKQGYRCSYTSPDGRRCEQRRWLDFHHVVPVSHGGLNTPDNLELRCHAHHSLEHENEVILD
jgi:hypothetical protein